MFFLITLNICSSFPFCPVSFLFSLFATSLFLSFSIFPSCLFREECTLDAQIQPVSTLFSINQTFLSLSVFFMFPFLPFHVRPSQRFALHYTRLHYVVKSVIFMNIPNDDFEPLSPIEMDMSQRALSIQLFQYHSCVWGASRKSANSAREGL